MQDEQWWPTVRVRSARFVGYEADCLEGVLFVQDFHDDPGLFQQFFRLGTQGCPS